LLNNQIIIEVTDDDKRKLYYDVEHFINSQ